MKGIRSRTVEIERDEQLEKTLKAFIEVDRSTKFIADFLAQKLGAKFHGIEKEALLKIVKEMKGMVKRYGTLIVYSGNYIVLGYPVAVVKYSLRNYVTYRFVALMKEYGCGYVVSGSDRVSIDTSDVDRIYSGDVLITMDSFLSGILPYDYEAIEREAQIDLDSDNIQKHGRIRIQGDLILEYEKLDMDSLRGHIRGHIVEVLERLVREDLMRALSRKLSIMRIDHEVSGNAIAIPISIKRYRKVQEIKEVMEGVMEKMLVEYGLERRKDYYNIEVRYRCPWHDLCRLIIAIGSFYGLSRFIGNDLIEELVDQVMSPIDYVINIGNHTVSFTALKNYVHINTVMPFSGDTVNRIVELNTTWYYADQEVKILTRHSEHGENTLKIHTESPLTFRLWTIPKSDIHILSRNKIALRELIEKYKQYSINVVDDYNLLWKLGTTSGKEIDKVKKFNLKVKRGNKLDVPVLENALGVIEAKVINFVDIGAHRLFIGEVVDYYGDVEEYGLKEFWKVPLHKGGKAFASINKYLNFIKD